MQSTNEEMQSTNEELTTSKEEMQSLNEELQTVNAELQGRLDELSLTNNDMRNLLNSTEVATVFLDKELRIRRFTTQATKITTLIPGDVGRPISDIACDLLYPGLTADAREVLRKLGSLEKPIRTGEGSWFSARIMPYRTEDDRIDGVVISYWDITDAKELEAKLHEMQHALENRLTGKSTELDKAKTELKAERKRTAPVKKPKT
jgi:two-component system CheB/CheR fusion protein